MDIVNHPISPHVPLPSRLGYRTYCRSMRSPKFFFGRAPHNLLDLGFQHRHMFKAAAAILPNSGPPHFRTRRSAIRPKLLIGAFCICIQVKVAAPPYPSGLLLRRSVACKPHSDVYVLPTSSLLPGPGLWPRTSLYPQLTQPTCAEHEREREREQQPTTT